VSNSTQLHQDAMARVEDALVARRRGAHERARELFQAALALELESAEQVTSQPSRSILFRSAAWLALEAEDPSEAERLAACGLADRGVPNRVKDELRAVAEEARLRLHRPLPPPTAASSLTLHVEGPEVGYGTAAPADIEPRKDALQHLVVRTAERHAGQAFRRRGIPPASLTRQLQQRVSYAAGSMVVQLTLGGDSPHAVGRERRYCGRRSQLPCPVRRGWERRASRTDPRRNIPREFRAACDTARPRRPSRHLGRRRNRHGEWAAPRGPSAQALSEREGPAKAPRSGPALETFQGQLRAADETTNKNTIKLLLGDAPYETVSIDVGDAVMEDIVRPLYGHMVRVTVQTQGKLRKMIGVPELVEGGDA
jgi:hypothetical protein